MRIESAGFFAAGDLMISGLLVALMLQDRDSVAHKFTFTSGKSYQAVYLAGTFNNWSNGVNPMKVGPDGRTWNLSLNLTPGKHLYKFVLDGKEWITDPKAAANEDDGNGNVNSVLLIMPKDHNRGAKKGDASITAGALRHDREAPYFNYDQGQLQLSLRVRPEDIGQISLMANGKAYAMHEVNRNEFYQTVQASLGWDRKEDIRYSFKLQDGKSVQFYGPKGLTAIAKGNEFVVSAKAFKPFAVPKWIEGDVIYQIFPDRFENGDSSNDPANLVEWNSVPNGDSRYGGDVAGIRKRMSYLQHLGVGAIYFNPVFTSPVIHRYETTNFKEIDSQFGTNEEFAKLTVDLEKVGIRTILDGVFNHTAPDFFAFKDILEKQQNSKYTDWYFINGYPVKVEDNPKYVGWWGVKSMPKLNVKNREVAQHLLSVPEFWAKNARVHGWRLDAANEVDSSFWIAFRNKVKSLDPNCWIVGEVWGDGTPWLKGDQWDSIMGYQFRDAAIRFVAEGKLKPSEFVDRLMSVYQSYAPQVSRNLMNLLSSHDTARFLTLCKGDQRLARLAATLQLTWVGTPSIYYGEEIGMEGDHDPGCRAGMAWERVNDQNPMLSHYRKLILARRSSAALRSGKPVALMSDDTANTLAYARVHGKDVVVVVANRSEQLRRVTIKLGPLSTTTMRDIFTGGAATSTGGTITVEVAPLSAAVLMPEVDNFRRPLHRSNQ